MQKKQSSSLSKRHFIGTLLAGGAVGAVPAVFAGQAGPASTENPQFPPGATKQSLDRQCIRCGICIQTCPAKVLVQQGGKDTWKPMLVGACKTGCTLCGQVCPTGAIPPKKS